MKPLATFWVSSRWIVRLMEIRPHARMLPDQGPKFFQPAEKAWEDAKQFGGVWGAENRDGTLSVAHGHAGIVTGHKISNELPQENGYLTAFEVEDNGFDGKGTEIKKHEVLSKEPPTRKQFEYEVWRILTPWRTP